jgi:hypothetical protein
MNISGLCVSLGEFYLAQYLPQAEEAIVLVAGGTQTSGNYRPHSVQTRA